MPVDLCRSVHTVSCDADREYSVRHRLYIYYKRTYTSTHAHTRKHINHTRTHTHI